MSTLPLPRLTITSEPGFVSAEQVGDTLIVNVSTIVRHDDEPLVPVLDFLEGRCFSVELTELIEDETMWHSESRYSHVRLYGSCPAWNHSCTTERHNIGYELGMRRMEKV